MDANQEHSWNFLYAGGGEEGDGLSRKRGRQSFCCGPVLRNLPLKTCRTYMKMQDRGPTSQGLCTLRDSTARVVE